MILIGKMYVYSCRVRECTIVFDNYVSRAREEFRVERKLVAESGVKWDDFNKRWDFF